MASMSSSLGWVFHHVTSPTYDTTIHNFLVKPKSEPNLLAASISVLGISRSFKNQRVLCCKTNPLEQQQATGTGTGTGTKRREALLKVGLAAFTLPSILSTNALAETAVAENFRVYTDDDNKFQISIPQEWNVGSGESNGFKSLTAFYPDGDSNSSVSVVITGLGPDFTKLESFGKVDEFAETLVGGLDRSWQRPPGVKAKLIDSKATKGFYYIEYTLQNPGESPRHLLSALGIAFNGWINRLYTVTGQFMEEESETYGSEVRKVVSSFRFI
ncbi:PsbP domain-containing protein 3, chloroplastic [Turnera subulata]|uniref:PsbP domain-containing protein 3, chloroplastic n=1 Tax=Turnera subulata TaxID=218843 RepID=A0A9Q0F6F8_9ROSI|nr:PsbP domain-containing protein 3, chloroplastic [Turnera subulata]